MSRDARTPSNRPSDEQLAHVYLDEGLTLKALGARYGYSASWARKRLEHAGIERRKPGVRLDAKAEDAIEAEVARLYVEELLSVTSIAARMTRSIPWVRLSQRAAA